MRRAYYSDAIPNFLIKNPAQILGEMTLNHGFDLDGLQRDSWMDEITHLQTALAGIDGKVYLEYSIPRMGKRVDAVLLIGSVIFVIEYKVGQSSFYQADVDQVTDYALDLSNFHEGSHNAILVPILIATGSKQRFTPNNLIADRNIYPVQQIDGDDLSEIIQHVLNEVECEPIAAASWEQSGYKPTPTIIEATLALYNQHSVEDIIRNDAGARNLAQTSGSVEQIIRKSKASSEKSIVFVTGVPGAGKTLVGLNTATRFIDKDDDLYSVFLSGNQPLVSILQEALARDKSDREKIKIGKARSEVKLFIQNVHHFRDDGVTDPVNAPPEHVVLFDEAQRAWNLEQTSTFMRTKKGVKDFDQSEPEFLISCMDRHKDWAVIVCLVGGGQEINRGEAGIQGWISAVQSKFPNWKIYASDQLIDAEYGGDGTVISLKKDSRATLLKELHLKSSMRSFRSEKVSLFVKQLLDHEVAEASKTLGQIYESYPIVLTRDIDKARQWLKNQARGSERYGIVVSSQAERLKPIGVHVRSPVDPVKWFLADKNHVRSSFFLEDVATEFHVQGLELDWACITWDADFRYTKEGWSNWSFKGNKWQRIRKPDRQAYQKNAYRVLLTRARQGMVIVVPEGNSEDFSRPSSYYDQTFDYLSALGIETL